MCGRRRGSPLRHTADRARCTAARRSSTARPRTRRGSRPSWAAIHVDVAIKGLRRRDYLFPQRPMTMMKTIITTVRTTAVTTPCAQPPQSPTVLVAPNLMFAAARPPSTTLFHISAMMKPNAAPRDAAIVFRTSAMESCFSSAIFYPRGAATCLPNKRAMFHGEGALGALRRTYSARRSPAGREDVPVERIAVTLRDIDAALPIVREVGRHTPTVPFSGDEDVWLKLENLQRLGAFKIRGVWNRISQLTDAERRRGVSTISSGNHGLAVAWAARRLGLPCTVRVPEGAVGRKVEAIHAEGADVSPISRSDLIDAHEKETWQSWPSAFLHPFAHPATVAGQGTIGREIVDDFSEVRTVLVPVGGGGLAAGIGTAVKGLVPRAQVFGVQAEGAAPLPVALRTRQSHRIDRPRTIADGIGIGIILPPMAEILGRVLDGALVVTDAEIRDAMRRLALEAKIVAEPAGPRPSRPGSGTETNYGPRSSRWSPAATWIRTSSRKSSRDDDQRWDFSFSRTRTSS